MDKIPQIFNPEVDYYNSIRSTEPQKLLLTDIFLGIKKGGSIKDLIIEIRSTTDKKKQTKLKGKLGVVTFNASFSPTKRAEDFVFHNGLLIADFDGYATVKELNKERKRIEADKHTLMCFLSPRGKGLKVLIKIPKPTADGHKLYFKEYGKYINSKHWDTTSQNVNRLCFVSYDPDIFLNQDSTLFNPKVTAPKQTIITPSITTQHTKTAISKYRDMIATQVYNKWENFNRIAILVGGFSATNSLDCDGQHALNELIQGARENANVLDQGKAEKQITNGFKYGEVRPLHPDNKEVKKSVRNINIIRYPLFVIHSKIYQEIRPGILKSVSVLYLNEKYGGSKNVPHKQTPSGFISVPSHTNYKSIIDDCYNEYVKLTHVPKEGDWDTIKAMIKHIFGDSYQMGMEYLWNLFVHPTQQLPFLGLVSTEKETGKSTFLNFVRDLFQENATPLNAHDFKKEFNSHYINKLVGLSDEHAEGSDRKLLAQKFKNLTTEVDQRVEKKGVESYSTKSYIKIILASNDEEMSTFIEEQNTRYWILKIDTIEEKKEGIRSTLKKEIPAFLYYILNEFKARKSRGRLYFAPKEFQTEASRMIQENSKPELQKEIEALLDENFTQNPDYGFLLYSATDLRAILGGNISRSYLNKILKGTMKKIPLKNQRYNPGTSKGQTKTGTPFLFSRFKKI